MKISSLTHPMLLIGVLTAPLSAHSAVISGNLSEWRESWRIENIGDGANYVTSFWSFHAADMGWFYGSDFTHDTDVALATDVTDISQITDASVFDFRAGAIGPYCDAHCSSTGVGTFIVFRNRDSGYYGVLRIDDIFVLPTEESGSSFNRALNGKWWFQTDGSSNFVPLPLPAAAWLFLSGFIVLFRIGRAGSRLNRRPALARRGRACTREQRLGTTDPLTWNGRGEAPLPQPRFALPARESL